MGILQNFQEGNMDALRSIKYAQTGVETPYVVKDIKNPRTTTGTVSEITRRADDLTRITKMFLDKPGLTHLRKEALLKQVDLQKKIEQAKANGDSRTTGAALLQQAGSTVSWVAKVIGSTLAQVPVSGTGTHFIRGFRTDTYLENSDITGGILEGGSGVNGANLAKQGQPIPIGGISTNPNDNNLTETQRRKQTTLSPTDIGIDHRTAIGTVSDLNPDKQPKLFDQQTIGYIGRRVDGNLPQGQEGGTTFIEDTIQSPLEKRVLTDGIDSKLQSDALSNVTDNYSAVEIVGASKPIIERDWRLEDFRTFSNRGYRPNTYTINYSINNIERKTGIGSPGKKKTIGTNSYLSYETSGGTLADYQDRINLLDVGQDLDQETIEDLIKFKFEILTPDVITPLRFRAYLTSFNDSYNGAWSSNKYIGRAEDMLVYSGFSRGISFEFKVAATSRQELRPLYRKLVTLASSTAPTYTTDNHFMRGTLVKLTIGDYIVSLPGVIENITYDWSTEYPWEIKLDRNETDVQQLPHVLDCSVTFKPIHDFVPVTGLTPFITNTKVSSDGSNFL